MGPSVEAHTDASTAVVLCKLIRTPTLQSNGGPADGISCGLSHHNACFPMRGLRWIACLFRSDQTPSFVCTRLDRLPTSYVLFTAIPAKERHTSGGAILRNHLLWWDFLSESDLASIPVSVHGVCTVPLSKFSSQKKS